MNIELYKQCMKYKKELFLIFKQIPDMCVSSRVTLAFFLIFFQKNARKMQFKI